MMVSVTLGGVVLEGVENVADNNAGNIIPLPMPLGGSTATEVFDMLGVLRTISVSGVLAGSISSIQTTITKIDGLVTGNQSTISFVDHTGLSRNVMIADVSFSWDVPGTKCNYNIKMFEGRGV